MSSERAGFGLAIFFACLAVVRAGWLNSNQPGFIIQTFTSYESITGNNTGLIVTNGNSYQFAGDNTGYVYVGGVGSQFRGNNDGTVRVDGSGAAVLGSIASLATLTNSGAGSLVLVDLTVGQVAKVTAVGSASLLLGAGTISNGHLLLPAHLEVERDQFLILAHLEPVDALPQVEELIELGLPGDARLAQRLQDLGVEQVAIELAGRDLIPRERVGQGRLADGQEVINRREHNAGPHALQLRGRAVWQVIFLDGKLGGAGLDGRAGELRDEVLHLEHGLHGALAVRRAVADDDGATVILQGARDDFRGGRTEAIDQHRERAIVDHSGVGIAVDLDFTGGILDLHDGTLADEKTGEIDGLGQETPAVVPQVEHEALDARGLELAYQAGDVLRRAGLFRVGLVAVGRAVEPGQGDDAKGNGLAVGAGHLKDCRVRAGGVELHDIPGDRDHLARGGIGRIGGLNRQRDLRALVAADLVHDPAELHADDFHGLRAGLGDGDNLVVRFKLFAEVGGTARDDLLHDAIVVLDAQHRADADELELHLNAKVLKRAGAEIGRVGVV